MELKICNAAARRRAFKTNNSIEDNIPMNNLWSQKSSELRSHSQYNVKLSVSTSREQRKSMLRREKCFWCLSYSWWHCIVSANKTVYKLLRQVSTTTSAISAIKANFVQIRFFIQWTFFYHIYLNRVVELPRVFDLKLPINFPTKDLSPEPPILFI